MQIKTKVNHDYIKLKEIQFDFRNYGIYMLSGENGVGKSSIMKQLVYEDNQVECNTSQQQKAYETDKQDLISYVSQDPQPYQCSVKEYITRFCRDIKEEEIERYKEKFGITYLDNRKKVSKLSGGELVKLCLIGAILKKTPYIFLDEPTNNLDNPSVRVLIDVLEELANDRSIIIISHDPRLEIEQATRISITEDIQVTKEPEGKTEVNRGEISHITFPVKKLGFSFAKSSLISSVMMIILSILIFYGFINYALYEATISKEKIHRESKNVIVSYKADEEYQELNRGYAKRHHLTIDKKKYYQIIYFQNVEELSKLKNVEKILLCDNQYMDEIASSYCNEGLLDAFHMIAVPNRVIKYYGGQLALPFDIRRLVAGSLPRDGKNEVALSMDMLGKFYHIKEKDPIGMEIEIEGETYKIVGISYYDIGIISYDDEKDMGFYRYNGKQSQKKMKDIEACLKAKDYVHPDASSNVIFYTRKGKERSVLNQLVEQFPAENYTSYEFDKGYKEYVNRRGYAILVVFNLLYNIITLLLIYSVFHRIEKLNSEKIEAFATCYCNQKAPRKVLHMWYAGAYLISFVISAVTIFCAYGQIFWFLFIHLFFFIPVWLLYRRKHESV